MEGNKDELRRIIMNIVQNAIHYTPAKGALSVSLERKGESRVLSVSDTGVGISKEDLPHIFERFYKADSARVRTEGGGSGLGLSIVKELVERHKGRITAESKPGKGTTVTVVF